MSTEHWTTRPQFINSYTARSNPLRFEVEQVPWADSESAFVGSDPVQVPWGRKTEWLRGPMALSAHDGTRVFTVNEDQRAKIGIDEHGSVSMWAENKQEQDHSVPAQLESEEGSALNESDSADQSANWNAGPISGPSQAAAVPPRESHPADQQTVERRNQTESSRCLDRSCCTTM